MNWTTVACLCLYLVCARSAANQHINQICTSVINPMDCRVFAQKPMCASNGITYGSECEFTKAHCLTRGLTIVHNGHCSMRISTTTTTPSLKPTPSTVSAFASTKTGTTNSPTTPSSKPSTNTVSTFAAGRTGTSNNQTTSQGSSRAPVTNPGAIVATVTLAPNITVLTAASTVSSTPAATNTNTMTSSNNGSSVATALPTIPPNSSPLCVHLLSTVCETTVNELCANDGKTYHNYCLFCQARCYQAGLLIAYNGQCSGTDTFPPLTTQIPRTTPPSVFDIICDTLQQTQCQDDGIVICATDGLSYKSACAYEKAKCLDPSLNRLPSC